MKLTSSRGHVEDGDKDRPGDRQGEDRQRQAAALAEGVADREQTGRDSQGSRRASWLSQPRPVGGLSALALLIARRTLILAPLLHREIAGCQRDQEGDQHLQDDREGMIRKPCRVTFII